MQAESESELGWKPGTSVVWRSLPGREVGTVLAAFVVEDSAEAIVLFQPEGAPRKHRTGLRGGPSGRNMLPNGWDRGYADSTLAGSSFVRLHPPGERFSVIRRWDDSRGEYQGWYANLELPWARTPIGFDSRDDVLDIRVADDLSGWRWKDEDEFDWSVQVGKISTDEARDIRADGEHVVRMIESGSWPFQESAWSRYRPPAGCGLPQIPEDWARTTWV